MKNNMQFLKENFKKHGYVKVNCIDKKKLLLLKKNFAKMIEVSLKKNLNYSVNIRNKSKKVEFLLNKGMIYLEKSNKNFSLDILIN